MYSRTCRDELISQEEYEIWTCKECEFFFTQYVPDQKNIGRYYQSNSYIFHATKGKDWFTWLSHFFRKYITLPRRRKWVERLNGNNLKTMLDIGCGTGEWLSFLKKKHWDVLGIEPDADVRRYCVEVKNVPVKDLDALQHLPDASFSVITLWHSLEHMHYLHETMLQIKRLLRPGGFCLIALPNIEAKAAKQYETYWAAYDVPRHVYHFSSSTVSRLAGMHHLAVTEYRALPLDTYFICLLSEKYKKGSYVRGVWNAVCAHKKSLHKMQEATSLVVVLRHADGDECYTPCVSPSAQ